MKSIISFSNSSHSKKGFLCSTNYSLLLNFKTCSTFSAGAQFAQKVVATATPEWEARAVNP